MACDTCEMHYHLGCAVPPLKSIPDGAWICVNCRRETRSMLSSQDEMSCEMEQPKDSVNGGDNFVEKEKSHADINGSISSPNNTRASEDNIDGVAGSRKRKVEKLSGSFADGIRHVLFKRKIDSTD